MRTFDAAGLWDTVDATQVPNPSSSWAMRSAGPLLAELDSQPDRWSLASLEVMHSAGVMWSREVKEGLFEHLRDDVDADRHLRIERGCRHGKFASRPRAPLPTTASFMVGALAQVLSENGGFVEPGSGEVGLAAFGGPMPVGYYKDEKKSAETFRTIDGKRWSVPGDFATVEVDGSMKLLGRGSVCINTGGEKVFVEEVEEVLKLHDQVHDAVCVGIPHERFGETVCAVVEANEVGTTVDAMRSSPTSKPNLPATRRREMSSSSPQSTEPHPARSTTKPCAPTPANNSTARRI